MERWLKGRERERVSAQQSIDTHTFRQPHRHRHRHTNGQTDTQTDTQQHTHTHLSALQIRSVRPHTPQKPPTRREREGERERERERDGGQPCTYGIDRIRAANFLPVCLSVCLTEWLDRVDRKKRPPPPPAGCLHVCTIKLLSFGRPLAKLN